MLSSRPILNLVISNGYTIRWRRYTQTLRREGLSQTGKEASERSLGARIGVSHLYGAITPETLSLKKRWFWSC